MSNDTVTIAGIPFSRAAAEFIEEIGFVAFNVTEDLDDLRDGTRTRDGLLAVCMQGADDDRLQGATDYVDALADALAAVAP